MLEVKDDKELVNVISNLLKDMAELKALATRHGLDYEHYFSDYLMGETRKIKLIRKSAGNKLKSPCTMPNHKQCVLR